MLQNRGPIRKEKNGEANLELGQNVGGAKGKGFMFLIRRRPAVGNMDRSGRIFCTETQRARGSCKKSTDENRKKMVSFEWRRKPRSGGGDGAALNHEAGRGSQSTWGAAGENKAAIRSDGKRGGLLLIAISLENLE